MVTEAQYKLFEALKAHRLQLETERDGASKHNQAGLDRRIEAARKLLEWLSTVLEPGLPGNSNDAAVKRCG
jgi:hypothetical protein